MNIEYQSWAVLYTINDMDMDKCFTFIVSFLRNLHLCSSSEDSMCCYSTTHFFSNYAKFYSFILVIFSGSLIFTQIWQTLSFCFFPFPFPSFSIVSPFLFPCCTSGLHTEKFEFQFSLDVINLLCRDRFVVWD